MPEPPELAHETVSPDELLQRLDIVRERFRTGLITASDFNTAIRAFQFADSVGHLWAPGATSNQWYRWDGNQWTAAAPPPLLKVPQAPILFTDYEEEAADARRKGTVAPSPSVDCPQCGAPNPGKKFCTRCGTKLG
jgi:hypothetical protein